MPSLNIDIPKSRCKGQGKSSRSVSHNIDKVVHESHRMNKETCVTTYRVFERVQIVANNKTLANV